MDASDSPGPSDEGGQSGSARAEPAEPLEQNTDSFLKGWFRRASGALAAGSGSDGELTESDLGPVFDQLSAAERAMVMNILRLRELRVEDVMTPRADVAAVPEDIALPELLTVFETAGHSRLPVYRETLDDPLGFVHLKDLAMSYGVGRNCEPSDFAMAPHVRDALFVPPSMKIAALLQKMQAGRVHMALVIDEFGGVDGLVTIEDLVEQVVGDIEDEHDRQEIDRWREEVAGVYVADAKADIREFEEAEGVALVPQDWEEEVDTLGGLVFMLLGRVPARGEVIVHPGGHEFEIIDADPRRIRRLRLTVDTTGTEAGDIALRAAAE